ncbi:MAG: Sec-independent protein translocase protein TatCd [Candidatus Omnitrophica bacterium]|nr:Sec-independent protein translocase protein TatCd [Candidatus Omnitrophota bacterium]
MAEKVMSLAGHLDELRRRSIAVFVCFLAFSSIAFYHIQTLLGWVKIPAGDLIGPLAVLSPTSALLVFIKLSAAVGLAMTVPIFLIHVWSFVRPALDEGWSVVGLVFIVGGTLLFLSGASLGFFVLAPASLRFLLNIGREQLQFIITLDEYVSFVLALGLAGGTVFQMPLIVYVLAKVGLLTAALMIRGWRIAMVLILIIAGIATPTPDVFNMLIMAVPMLVLYGISIVVAGMAARPATPNGSSLSPIGSAPSVRR